MDVSSHSNKVSNRSSIWSKLVKYVLPLAISVGLCYVLFHDMDFAEMLAFIKADCQFSWIFLSMAIGISGFFFRALRWRMQLKASDIHVPLMPVVYSIVGTYAVNLVLPRLGELWRCEYIARRSRAPFATVFGSMFAERTADTLTVALLFLLTFLLAGPVITTFIDQNTGSSSALTTLITSPLTYLAALIILAIAAWLLWRFRTSRLVRRLASIWHDLLGGFLSIFHIKGGWLWLLLTLCLWGSYFIQMWACFRAFGTTSHFMAVDGIIIVLVCFTLGSISMGIPSNGGIGPYQIALVFGLRCFVPDLNPEQGYSFANVVLGAQTLLVIICGLLSFAAIALDNRRHNIIKSPHSA